MQTYSTRPRRSGMSLMEMLVVLAIMEILVSLTVTRYAAHGQTAKVNACEVNRRNIEIQSQLWFRDQGTWPAANLSDISTDTSYLSDGLPTCPVDGTSYTFDSATRTITGHAH